MFMHILKKKKQDFLLQHKNRNTQKSKHLQHHTSHPIRSSSSIKATRGSCHSCF